jgi:hypothetical protein
MHNMSIIQLERIMCYIYTVQDAALYEGKVLYCEQTAKASGLNNIVQFSL